MKDSARYVKIVEWSDEDRCYVGSAPGLFYGGCHGDDERAVFAELCDIVEETIALYREANRPLPPATSGAIWSIGFRASHRRAAAGHTLKRKSMMSPSETV